MKARRNNIEDLLNGFIDGVLTTRQKTQVHRLIANDPKIAQRLNHLRKYKTLMGALPQTQAPETMLNDIKAALARRALLDIRPAILHERAGARELMFRKLYATAAMIALVAVLGAVVWTIVAPETPTETDQPFIARDVPPPEPLVIPVKFNGRLELRTVAFKEVDSAVNKAVKANPLVRQTALDRTDDRITYVLTCDRKGLSTLLAQFDQDWHRFGETTLFVETENFAKPVVVAAVTPAQITEITNQNSFGGSIRVAKDLAVLNNMTEQLRTRTLLAADDRAIDLTTIPMVHLTKPEGPADTVRSKATINLTIVIRQAKYTDLN